MSRYNCVFGMRAVDIDVKLVSNQWVSSIRNDAAWGLQGFAVVSAASEEAALKGTIAAIEAKWGVTKTACYKLK
jgi:hypothetical protein